MLRNACNLLSQFLGPFASWIHWSDSGPIPPSPPLFQTLQTQKPPIIILPSSYKPYKTPKIVIEYVSLFIQNPYIHT